MSDIIHVGAAQDGSVLQFPFSAKYWLKVCNPFTGVGGIVDLTKGAYYSVSEIERLGLGLYCKQVYRDLNECFYDGESED
jgi:hypothetical protein